MTDIDNDILRDYARARATVAPGESLTLIEIGRERTTLVSSRDDTAYGAIALQLTGFETLPGAWTPHESRQFQHAARSVSTPAQAQV